MGDDTINGPDVAQVLKSLADVQAACDRAALTLANNGNPVVIGVLHDISNAAGHMAKPLRQWRGRDLSEVPFPELWLLYCDAKGRNRRSHEHMALEEAMMQRQLESLRSLGLSQTGA